MPRAPRRGGTPRQLPGGRSRPCVRSPGCADGKRVCGLPENRTPNPNPQTPVGTTPSCHRGTTGGGGGRGDDRPDPSHLNAIPKHKHHTHDEGRRRARVWAGGGRLSAAHLSWQPYSASVKTRYRNVLWVTFKTRYKSSAL